jgi:hypothetical protein
LSGFHAFVIALNAEPATPLAAFIPLLNPAAAAGPNPAREADNDPKPPVIFVPRLAEKLPDDIACDTELPAPVIKLLEPAVNPVDVLTVFFTKLSVSDKFT